MACAHTYILLLLRSLLTLRARLSSVLERFNRKLARLLASDTAPPLGASESEKPGG